jgi:fimbrial isopeptide formation D2 family protein/LPXTG-motif cell wall-anchored protein
MKSYIKRILSLVLATLFAVLMPISAFALTNSGTGATESVATINSKAEVKITGANKNDSLSMYKIIYLTDENNKLVYHFTENFQKYLTSINNTITIDDYFDYSSNSDDLKELLDGYGVYIFKVNADKDSTNDISADVTTTDKVATDGTLTFTNVPVGQYIILSDGNTSGTYVYQTATAKVIPHTKSGNYMIYSQYTVAMKTTEPTMQKSIDSSTASISPTNNGKLTADIGDTISYKIEATVPTFPIGAVNKTLFITDTPAAGVTVDLSTIKLYDKNGKELTKGDTFSDSTYTVSYVDGTIYIDINYDNFINETNVPERVIVKYDAMLNDNAAIASANENTAEYVYSNNPYAGSTYDPDSGDDRPDPGTDPAYGSITDTAEIYTYGLVVEKYDEATTSTKLAGAVFEVHRQQDCKDAAIATITTGDDGLAIVNGLRAGEYYLKEITAPIGYTASTEVTHVTIGDATSNVGYKTQTTVEYTSEKTEAFNYGKTNALVTQATDKDGNLLYIDKTNADAPVVTTDETDYPAYIKSITTTKSDVSSTTELNYVYESIANKPASAVVLPGTGSIGIVPFIAVGSVLMIGAAIILITKKRMNGAVE